MERRPKSDPTFEAMGNMDELNACLAVAAEHSDIAANGLSDLLRRIQSLLFDAAALVATPRDNSSQQRIARTEFPHWCTEHLEVEQRQLPSRRITVASCDACRVDFRASMTLTPHWAASAHAGIGVSERSGMRTQTT